MTDLLTYRRTQAVATISLDDGKVNVMSLKMLAAVNDALDQALWDQAVVVIAGRPGVFSAGFDLPVLRAGGAESAEMVRRGFVLAERLLSFPLPVVIACTGHALAMGAFLVLFGRLPCRRRGRLQDRRQ
jgi:enoyl-CoA hydratase